MAVYPDLENEFSPQDFFVFANGFTVESGGVWVGRSMTVAVGVAVAVAVGLLVLALLSANIKRFSGLLDWGP